MWSINDDDNDENELRATLSMAARRTRYTTVNEHNFSPSVASNIYRSLPSQRRTGLAARQTRGNRQGEGNKAKLGAEKERREPDGEAGSEKMNSTRCYCGVGCRLSGPGRFLLLTAAGPRGPQGAPKKVAPYKISTISVKFVTF